MESGTKRFRFLDGLRGWAAVVVLLHHIFVDGLPADSVMADRTLWAKTIVLNGTLAVCVFFVVSGFSLSIRYLETGDERGLLRIAAGRYLRLVLPIFAICAITYVLLLAGIIAPATQRPDPLNLYLAFTPTLTGLLGFSLLDVFVSYSSAKTYDPPLWTMAYEFYGSFMVIAAAAAVCALSMRRWILLAMFLALAAWQSYFALFIAGILIGDCFLQFRTWKSAGFVGAALCAAGVVLAWLPPAWFGLSYIASATCLTAGAAMCAPVRHLLENRLGDFLGWISFPLYLVQAAVIYSFSLSGLDVLAALGFEPAAQRWIIGIATVPVAVFFAVVFCPVNDMAVTLSRRFGMTVLAWRDRLAGDIAPATGRRPI